MEGSLKATLGTRTYRLQQDGAIRGRYLSDEDFRCPF